MGEMITAPSPKALLAFEFPSDHAQALYENGTSIKSRVRALYGPKTHMRALVEPMCFYRAWTIDYFEQLPALQLWIADGVTHPKYVGSKQAEIIQRRIVDLFEPRPKLRDLQRRWSIPKCLRKLKGKALLPRHAGALRWLCMLNPSLVSQALPEPVKTQRRWLNMIDASADWGVNEEFRIWLIVSAAQWESNAPAHDMADFWRRGDGFDYRWSWAQASAARDRWHRELAVGRAVYNHGVDPDAVICRNPLPDHVEIEDLVFVALRTPLAIHEEGVAMHHCVGSYINDVARARCSIVGVRSKSGDRLATLEMVPMRGCIQQRGPCNAAVKTGLSAAIRQYGNAYWKATSHAASLSR